MSQESSSASHSDPSTATSTAASTERTYEVLLSRRDSVEAGLLALAKRGARRGLPALAWTWGKAFVETVYRRDPEGGVGRKIEVARVPLTLPTAAPRYAGWTFVAALQHLDGENLVRSIPGEVLPVEYRTRGPVCDHCRISRRRNDTYVLRHDDGRVVQVGSTCIGDFLGSDDAGRLASLATMLADAASLAGDEDEGGGFGGSTSAYVLAQYLPIVAWEVRTLGWVSRTAAREHGTTASADHAWFLMVDPEKARRDGIVVDVTDEDRATAAAAETWAESLTDAEVDAEKGDYLHNLRAVARAGLASSRTAGIAASTIVAYQRHLGRERARVERAARPTLNEHVGVVGERTSFDVVLDFVTGYESDYGYVTVLKFRTPEGATIVWKASSTEIGRADVGKRYALTGAVKKHDEYKGQKQTMLTRCKLVERAMDDASPIVQPKAKKAKKAKPVSASSVETKETKAIDQRSELAEHRGTHDASNSWWVNDARGIPLCRVCDACEGLALSAYRPEVLGRGPGRYEDVVEEPIESEDA